MLFAAACQDVDIRYCSNSSNQTSPNGQGEKELFMEMLRRALLTTCLALFSASTMALTFGTPSTISGLRWTASGTLPAADCTDLQMDLIGDLANSTRFSQIGALNCGTHGTYAVSGSGYLTVANTLSFTITVGVFNVWFCSVGVTSLAGSCTTYLSSGSPSGTVTLTPRP